MQHHFFVVRPTQATRSGRIQFLLATGTWTAYNDWGGANHYLGVAGENGQSATPVLSLQRPWTRGMVWLPAGAPRIAHRAGHAAPFRRGTALSHEGLGLRQRLWPVLRRCRLCAKRAPLPALGAGGGARADIITQHDLHFRPELLEGYSCLVVVGHDEYWSYDMRKSVEAWTERGGNLARFGGNYMW